MFSGRHFAFQCRFIYPHLPSTMLIVRRRIVFRSVGIAGKSGMLLQLVSLSVQRSYSGATLTLVHEILEIQRTCGLRGILDDSRGRCLVRIVARPSTSRQHRPRGKLYGIGEERTTSEEVGEGREPSADWRLGSSERVVNFI